MTAVRSEAFDEMAGDYDDDFTRTPLGICLRTAVLRRAESCFAGHERILEIGCGTGEDAIHLAQQGHSILATDSSARMIEIARRKATQAGCKASIEFRCMPMERIGIELARERFAGAFSNFGAINCATDVSGLSRSIAAMLTPRAALLWVIMGPYVPWEWVWFITRLEWRKAFRRLSREGTQWRGIRVQYPSPGNMSRCLDPYFTEIRCRALGLVLPPTYAAGWLNRRPRLLNVLTRAENLASRLKLSASFSDHYMIEAHR